MIYFDNAATSYPKPDNVPQSVLKANLFYGGNPGRSGHKLSLLTSEKIFSVREQIAKLFNASPENVVFTNNCTHALNTVIHGLYENNKTIVTSNLEHNSVSRPIYNITRRENVKWLQVDVHNKSDEEIVLEFEKKIDANCCLVVCVHASNVTGQILPVEKIYNVCRKMGVAFVIDAAQTAGVVPIDIKKHANIICAAGHKGLYGPMGTGILILNDIMPRSLTQGGTGSSSILLEPPLLSPDSYEAGTVNTPGIIGLGAGIKFIDCIGIDKIRRHELKLCKLALSELKNADVFIYNSDYSNSAPILLFNFKNISSSKGSKILSDEGFALRGGVHCAPLAHENIGTLPKGAIRFSPSIFNNEKQTLEFCRTVKKIASKKN